jgi:hypothetical protein
MAVGAPWPVTGGARSDHRQNADPTNPALKGAGDVRFPVIMGIIGMWCIGTFGAWKNKSFVHAPGENRQPTVRPGSAPVFMTDATPLESSWPPR